MKLILDLNEKTVNSTFWCPNHPCEILRHTIHHKARLIFPYNSAILISEYVHSYMYYLCMCNELYSASNCIDYARSAFMTRHVNMIYIIYYIFVCKFVYIFRTDENPFGSCQPCSNNTGQPTCYVTLVALFV